MPDPPERPSSERLLPDEELELRTVFGDAVELHRIRLRFDGILTLGGYARTLGNLVAFPSAYRRAYRSLDRRCWLVHEATHVWQNQVLGKRYIPGAIWEHLTRRDPYAFELFPPRPFLSYAYEAQASVVAELYRMRCRGQVGPERQRLEQLLAELIEISRSRQSGALA
jgi:hypothetical protein